MGLAVATLVEGLKPIPLAVVEITTIAGSILSHVCCACQSFAQGFPQQMELWMTVAQFIEQVMTEKRLSALEIERRCNYEIADSTITRIVRGEVKRPTDKTLRAIARGMEIPEEEILRVARGIEPSEAWTAREALEAMSKIVSSPELTEAVKSLLAMKAEELKRAAKYLKRK